MKFRSGWVLGLMLVSANAFAVSAYSEGFYAEESFDELQLSLEVSEDPYAELERLFEQGTLPSQSDVLGWYSGRGYGKSNPAKPNNALLVGEKISLEGNGGPLFPPKEVLKILPIANSGEPEDLFDTLTLEIESGVRSFLDSSEGWPAFSPVQTQGESLVSLWVNGPYEYHFRKVTLAGKMHEGKSYLVVKTVYKDNVNGYAYFFKKVK